MSDDEQDVMALAGLRRLVLLSRDKLRAVTLHPPAKDPAYNANRWTPDEIRQYAAFTLADHVMTLVLDCLPSPDGISADEAEALRNLLDSTSRQRNELVSDVESLRSEHAAAQTEAQERIESLAVELGELQAIFDDRSESLGVGDDDSRPYEEILDDLLIERDRLRDQLEALTQNRGAS